MIWGEGAGKKHERISYIITSEPRPPGASRPRSERPCGSLIRRQRQPKARERGGGAQEPALPAAAATSRNSSRLSPCAPQRSAAARGCGRPCRPDTYRCLGVPTASLPRFSPPADAGRGDPSQGNQGEVFHVAIAFASQ